MQMGVLRALYSLLGLCPLTGLGRSGAVMTAAAQWLVINACLAHYLQAKKSAARGRRSRYCSPSYSRGMISSATMLMILINGLMAGPAVSL